MHKDTYLRRVLLADGLTSGAAGLVMMLGAGLFAPVLGIPQELLFYAGLSLLPFMVLLVIIATRKNLSLTAVWAVVALNALWIAGCIVLVFGGWIAPTAFGYAFVLVQILVPLIFAALTSAELRKMAGLRQLPE